MALAWIGESAASAAIGNLVDAAISHAWTSRAGPNATQDEIQRLRQASQQIQAILEHVEKGQTVSTEQNKALNDWLWQLRDAVDQAEDVLDEMEYYELEKAAQAGDDKVEEQSEDEEEQWEDEEEQEQSEDEEEQEQSEDEEEQEQREDAEEQWSE